VRQAAKRNVRMAACVYTDMVLAYLLVCLLPATVRPPRFHYYAYRSFQRPRRVRALLRPLSKSFQAFPPYVVCPSIVCLSWNVPLANGEQHSTCPTGGPRAGSGPRDNFIRPATEFGKKTIFAIGPVITVIL
jgi:hypothetical protein